MESTSFYVIYIRVRARVLDYYYILVIIFNENNENEDLGRPGIGYLNILYIICTGYSFTEVKALSRFMHYFI